MRPNGSYLLDWANLLLRWANKHVALPMNNASVGPMTAVSAVVLNLYFNGSRGGEKGAVDAAKVAEAH